MPLAGPAAGARATVIDVQPSRLQYALEAAAEQGVDLVVIDTPPRSESAALEAARVANLVVIPCRAQILDLEGIVKLRLTAVFDAKHDGLATS